MRLILGRASGALALACLCVAAALALSAATVPAKAVLAQWLLELAWRRSTAQPEQAVRPWPWADASPVARLDYGGRSQVVLAGTQGSALAFAPTWLAGTASPGEPGTAVIAAHRDTHFHDLGTLVPGDEVIVETPAQARLTFRVDLVEVRDTHRGPLVLRDDGGAHLLLITCFPFDAVRPGGPLRYLVWARRHEGGEPSVAPDTSASAGRGVDGVGAGAAAASTAGGGPVRGDVSTAGTQSWRRYRRG